jgi:hypothetical protein
MAYYFGRLGGVRRPTSAGRFGGLGILWSVTGFKSVCGHRFNPGSNLQLEIVKRSLQHQEWTIIERSQRRLGGVMLWATESCDVTLVEGGGQLKFPENP